MPVIKYDWEVSSFVELVIVSMVDSVMLYYTLQLNYGQSNLSAVKKLNEFMDGSARLMRRNTYNIPTKDNREPWSRSVLAIRVISI